jgi:hypothetical protein
MSLIGFEGFDDIASTGTDETFGTGLGTDGSGSSNYWTRNAALTKVSGQLGGSAIQLTSNGSYECHLAANYTRLIWGGRFKVSSLTTTIVAFFDGSSTIQCALSVNGSGNLIFHRTNNPTGQIGSAGSTVITTGTWFYAEVDVTFNSSSGAFTVRLGGSGTEISGSGVNTVSSANNYANGFGWAAQVNSQFGTFDDMYLLDPTTGSAPFTSMLGVCRVETLFPTANNSVTWTPNASTNVSQVQETSMDSDTTYNSIAATTGQDTFAHGSLSSTPTTIYAVAVRAVMRKDDVFNSNAQTTLISGGTTQQGASNNQTTTYQTNRDIYLNDPNTSAAWGATAVNNSFIGYNRVT